MMDDNPDVRPPAGLNPQSLPLGYLAKVLSGVGAEPVTIAMLQADIAAGAPTNADGTINLVRYTAWLVKEMAHGD